MALDAHAEQMVATYLGAVATAMANGNAAVLAELLSAGAQVVTPGFEYFRSRFITPTAPLSEAMQFFKAARVLDPRRVRDIPSALADAMTFKFLTADAKLALQKEFATYVSLAERVAHDLDLLEWWRSKRSLLPSWSRLAFIVALVSPSSATVERVFSMLRSLINDQQESALEDFVESSLTIRYNNLSRAKLPEDVLRGLELRAFGL
jgi:hypothetical protein